MPRTPPTRHVMKSRFHPRPDAGPMGDQNLARSRQISATTIQWLANERRILLEVFACDRCPGFAISRRAATGITNRDTSNAEIRARVLVHARGLKSFPSAASMVNTGRKLMTVVERAVRTAWLTSLVALRMIWVREVFGEASCRCLRMFSQTTIPMSTMVPMAMAIPERATTLAPISSHFMAPKHIKTAKGRSPEIRIELRR